MKQTKEKITSGQFEYLQSLYKNLEELKDTKIPFTKSKKKEIIEEINFLKLLIKTIEDKYDVYNTSTNHSVYK